METLLIARLSNLGSFISLVWTWIAMSFSEIWHSPDEIYPQNQGQSRISSHEYFKF